MPISNNYINVYYYQFKLSIPAINKLTNKTTSWTLTEKSPLTSPIISDWAIDMEKVISLMVIKKVFFKYI